MPRGRPGIPHTVLVPLTRARPRHWQHQLAVQVSRRAPRWPKAVDGGLWLIVLVGQVFAAVSAVSGSVSAVLVLVALACRIARRPHLVTYPLTVAVYAMALACDNGSGALLSLMAAMVALTWRTSTGWRLGLGPAAALCGVLYVGWSGAGGNTDVVWGLVAATLVGTAAGVAIIALERTLSLEHETTALRGRARASEQQARWLAERTALARELHDVVGHHVTAMVVQAEAGKVGDPQAALDAVGDLGRQALGELDALVVHLRDPDSELNVSAPPRLSDIDELLAAPLRGQGVAVHVDVDDAPGLDDAGTLTAYRITQEALTNVSRHARAETAWVEVTRTGAHVHVRISDDGVGPPPTSDHGSGLLGIEERVTAQDGVWAIGRRPGGGTSIDAFLPVHEGDDHRA